MNIFSTKNCWIIEDYLDENILNDIKSVIQNNLNNLHTDKDFKKRYSPRGQNIRQYWLTSNKNNFYVKDENFYTFEKKYRDFIFDKIKSTNLLDDETKNKISLSPKDAWTVIGESDSYHTIHCHNQGHFDGISTLVYLEVPETNQENQTENNLYLVTNFGPKNPYYNTMDDVMTVNPEVGKVLIFPDWTLHGTYPQSEGIRQTFNIDYTFFYKTNKNKLRKGIYY